VSDIDPPRFLEPGSGAPEELRSLFAAGAEDFPTDAELARLADKLGPTLGPSGGTAPTGTGSGVTTGLKLGLAALAAAGIAALVLSQRPPTEHAAPSAVTARGPETNPVAPSAPAAPAPSPSEPPAGAPAPEPPTPSAASARAVIPPAFRPAETEAEYLERARGALGKSPALALALANQHRSRFPYGVLAQEREVIAIEALKRLGRSAEAERRSSDFASRYPNSAYRKKLEAGSGK
jgi:hypothetical protein